jgi:hypothetical protein
MILSEQAKELSWLTCTNSMEQVLEQEQAV